MWDLQFYDFKCLYSITDFKLQISWTFSNFQRFIFLKCFLSSSCIGVQIEPLLIMHLSVFSSFQSVNQDSKAKILGVYSIIISCQFTSTVFVAWACPLSSAIISSHLSYYRNTTFWAVLPLIQSIQITPSNLHFSMTITHANHHLAFSFGQMSLN